MKKILCVLMMTLVMGACGESATDVATRGGGGGGGDDGDGFVPPDTVIKTDEALVRGYAAGNPVAVNEASALAAGGPLGDALDVAQTHGYGFDASSVVLARLELIDGRDAVLGIGKLAGGADGLVVYTRVDDREVALPLRLAPATPEGVEVLRVGGKTSLEPDNIPIWAFLGGWWGCVLQAMADIMACIQQCPDGSCWQSCIWQALMKLSYCLRFTMM